MPKRSRASSRRRRLRVPEGEGEHAAQVRNDNRGRTPRRGARSPRCRSGVRSGDLRRRARWRSSLEVVDLAVADDADRAVLVRDRLIAGLEVDDAQAPKPRPMPGATRKPSPSGPRCRSQSDIRWSISRSTGRIGSEQTTPQMPHMAPPLGSRSSCPTADSLAPAQQVQHAIRRLGASLVDHGEPRRSEGRQHIVFDPLTLLRPSDADANAADLIRSKRLEDRAHAAVATVAGPRPHAHRADRKVEVVMDENEIGRAEPQALADRPQPRSRRIHPRRRLEQEQGPGRRLPPAPPSASFSRCQLAPRTVARRSRTRCPTLCGVSW